MTLFWRRFALCLCLALTIPLVVPTYFTFGLERVYNKEMNITGTACRRLTSTTQTPSLIHSAICALLVVIIGIALIILYLKIASVIYRQNKLNMREPRKKTNISLMFMVITIVFLVSFLPRMITFLLEGIIINVWGNSFNRRICRCENVRNIVRCKSFGKSLCLCFYGCQVCQRIQKGVCMFL